MDSQVYSPVGNRVRHALMSAAVLSCLVALGQPLAALAQPAAQTQAWNLPAGRLDRALEQLAGQSGLQIVYAPELLDGMTTTGLGGEYAPGEALRRILVGTGLIADELNGTTFVLRRLSAGEPLPSAKPATRAQQNQPGGGATAPPTNLAEVAVTGTRIRGGSTPSPVVTIGAENIREEGFADLGDAVRSLPQNFSGGQNPEVPSGNLLQAGVANQNVTGGSGLNLRGLGPDATLTLLNGRRMSYSGFSQALDIGSIPVDAVERIEIVPDGASAIYGSDAVGGVGNVVLKRDFDGVKLGVRYGAATDGGLATREYTATAGHFWSSGGLIAAYRSVSADPILARQRDYTTYLANPTTIYPSNDLRSGLFSLHQKLGNVVELQLDVLRSSRDQVNAFFLSRQPQYYRIMPETTTTWISPSAEFFLSGDWVLSIGAAWGDDESLYRQSLEDIPTGASTLVVDNCFCNELRTYEAGAEGPLFALPGGEARLAIGAGYRVNQFRQSVERGVGILDLEGDEKSRFAYAEVNLPWVGAESGIPGVERLLLTAATRMEDYDSFGRVTTPQFGLIYGPSADFSVKGSWGKSFKAPTLYQKFNSVTALLYPAAVLGGVGYPAGATAIYLQGGNRDLKPERARTWTASLAFHPEAWPNLQAELTWFDIEYTDRVVFPFASASQGLRNPIYAPFVEYAPTANTQAAVIASADTFLNSSGAAYDSGNVVAILYGRFSNVVEQQIRGLDLSGSYRFDLAAGRLTIRGSASWLDSSQQLSHDQAETQLAGTLFNPAKVNGRLGAVWGRGDVVLSTFANYVSGVTDRVSGREGGSFTTFDATLRYAIDRPEVPMSAGWDFALSAQNLFNREPPFRAPASLIYSTPYDPTNYSAIGRFVSLSVSKQW